MPVGAHDAELLDIGPDALVRSVKYVGTVDMSHDAGLGIALRMAVARHMRAFIDHEHVVPGFSESATNDRAAESSADDAISHPVQFRLF
jgi:hypothetical protein